VGSLAKNTIAGTLNSVNKITGSLASGFSALSLVNNINCFQFFKK